MDRKHGLPKISALFKGGDLRWGSTLKKDGKGRPFVSVCQRLSVVTLLFQYLLARTSQLNDYAEGNMLRLVNFC